MSYSYSDEDLKELERIKVCGLGGRSPDDINQIGYSLYHFIREQFKINEVPKRIQDSLESLKSRLDLASEQWELTLDVIINEIELIREKAKKDKKE